MPFECFFPRRFAHSARRLFLGLSVISLGTALIAAPVEIITPELAGAMQPQVAATPVGAIHVVFGKETTVYHASSNDGGRTFTPATVVGELPKLALGMRRGPRIIAGSRTLAVTAISHAEGDLHGWASLDRGATWKPTAVINDVKGSTREGLHAMAANENGQVFVTWLDLRHQGMELWGASSLDGGVTWSANALVYRSPDGHICECCHPSAAMGPQGQVAVMWRNWLGGARDMYSSVSLDAGKTFGPAEKLGLGTWKLNACPMDGGSIAFRPDGKPVTAWRREKTVFVSEAARPEQLLVSSAVQPVVVSTARGDYLFWESAGAVMLKEGAAEARKLADGGSFCSAAPRPKGGVVAVWQSEQNGKRTLRAEVLD